MGLGIERESFSKEEYAAFTQRLNESLLVLRRLLQQTDFDTGKRYFGAELENYIHDDSGNVLALNQSIIEQANNPQLTVELNKFNLEINLEPIAFASNAFTQLKQQLDEQVNSVRQVAASSNAHITPIGILPTLQNKDLGPHSMTDLPRYKSLAKQLCDLRGEDFTIDIKGKDRLQIESDQIALEGANTSFQFHLMVPQNKFADIFNAVQLTTSLVVAVGANSPFLLGHSLWDETRIALFKQSIDSRPRAGIEWRQPTRVTFGHGWVREDAWELFAEAVALYPPLFPLLDKEHPRDILARGELPELSELALHMGTIWPWNRPVYGPFEPGHIRLEMRALPAGPTNEDMVANAAFATGLAYGLVPSIDQYLARTPFRFAEFNFYRAAQDGLDATIVWPDKDTHLPTERPIIEVIDSLLSTAEQGLLEVGLAKSEIHYYLSIIEQRLSSKISGARWQRKQVEVCEAKASREEALKTMFSLYQKHNLSGAPVHEWPVEGI